MTEVHGFIAMFTLILPPRLSLIIAISEFLVYVLCKTKCSLLNITHYNIINVNLGCTVKSREEVTQYKHNRRFHFESRYNCEICKIVSNKYLK